jgi:phage shock protein A
MGLWKRLAQLLKSNVNDIVDGAADPERMLDQVVTEMRGQLVEAKKQVAVAIADERRFKQQVEAEQKASADWERKAVLAIKAGDDGLAKQALMRQRDHEGVAAQLAEQHAKQAHAVEQLKIALRALNTKIEESERKKSVLVARKRRADAVRSIEGTLSGMKESSAFEAFNRIEKRIDQDEAEADAEAELGREMTGSAVKQRFDDLERDASADDALAALKQKMGLTPPTPVAARVATPAEAEDDEELAELENALAELKAREGADKP